MAKFVKLMRYDAMGLGNHEFDGLVPFIRNMTDLSIDEKKTIKPLI